MVWNLAYQQCKVQQPEMAYMNVPPTVDLISVSGFGHQISSKYYKFYLFHIPQCNFEYYMAVFSGDIHRVHSSVWSTIVICIKSTCLQVFVKLFVFWCSKKLEGSGKCD